MQPWQHTEGSNFIYSNDNVDSNILLSSQTNLIMLLRGNNCMHLCKLKLIGTTIYSPQLCSSQSLHVYKQIAHYNFP